MQRKRKGADLSRNAIQSRRLREKRAKRTEDQIQEQNTVARVKMAEFRQRRRDQQRQQVSLLSEIMEKEKEGKKIISIDLDDAEDNAGEAENAGAQPETTNTVTSGRKNKKLPKAVKDILTDNNTKFMSNFDPEMSNRERRKLTRKLNGEGKKNGSIYDENGVINGAEKDICDCLTEGCPGCHFPCPKCRSCKCGVDCRVNRKWSYEAVENEAEVAVAKNTNFPNG